MKCPHCHFEWEPARIRFPRLFNGLGFLVLAVVLCGVWIWIGALLLVR